MKKIRPKQVTPGRSNTKQKRDGYIVPVASGLYKKVGYIVFRFLNLLFFDE